MMDYFMKTIVFGLICHTVQGQDISLNNYFSNGMVFQRDTTNIIWGYGTIYPDVPVQAECHAKHSKFKVVKHLIPEQVSTKTWQVETEPQPAHTTCTFIISESVVLEDVLYGDVWLCSGQSNMEFKMRHVENSDDEVANAAKYADNIRFTDIANDQLQTADPDYNQKIQMPWSTADDSQALYHMSAVCFLYAAYVYDVTGVPMGLVESDFGGTIIEAWSSPEALEACNVQPHNTGDKNSNTVLWNAMINPLLRVSLKGFLWYQGESNSGHNRDLYNCTFPALINDWRLKFSQNSGTPADAPFGFVQIATQRADSLNNNWSVVRWHQTADYGYAPNDVMHRVFMSTSLDTYDSASGYPGGGHPRYKQAVARRLANAGLNVAYGYEEYPLYGPFPEALEIQFGDTVVTVHFDSDLEYEVDSEISGFYFCPDSLYDCDSGSTVQNWVEVSKARVKQTDIRTVTVDLADFDVRQGVSIAYIWRETPVKEVYMLPIYSADEFRVPTPPFKFNLY